MRVFRWLGIVCWIGAYAFAGWRAFAAEPVDAAGLPPVELVLGRVMTNATHETQNDRQFLAHYSFERTKVQEERDRHGAVEKRSERTSVHTPAPGAAIRLPKLPDPVASQPYNPTNHSGRAFDKRDFALDADLLSRFRFTVVGKESFDNRDMVVLEFQPAAGHQPVHNIKDKFVNKAAGRVWVDAADWIVAKIALRLSEEVVVAGGLVGAVTAFDYEFERERTPEGVWFTRSVDWHLKGREFLSRKSIDYHEKRSKVIRVQ